MGGFEISLSGDIDPSVKYHSVMIYFLTSTAKTARNSVWRAVLVGRYPSVNQIDMSRFNLDTLVGRIRGAS